MKKCFLLMTIALGILRLIGCSKDRQKVQISVGTNDNVEIYEGEKRVKFYLHSLPYDME